MKKKNTYVNVRPARTDRILDFLSSNVSLANCGSSLIAILYWDTSMVSAAMPSVSKNLSKHKRNGIKKNCFDSSATQFFLKIRTFVQCTHGLLHVFIMRKHRFWRQEPSLTSTEGQESITRPIFEKTRRLECMRVIPITSWESIMCWRTPNYEPDTQRYVRL